STVLLLVLARSILAQEVLYRVYGNSDHPLGTAMSSAGDVDLDGWPDVITGDYMHDEAQVFSGRNGALLYRLDEGYSYSFRTSVCGAAAFDGDGPTDLLVGAPHDDHERGTVSVYSGRSAALLKTISGAQYSLFGHSVSGAGDVNADGFPDFIVGAPTDGTYGS